MKGSKFLLLLVLCFLFAVSMASASISIDEDFSDDTPFTNLGMGALSSGTLHGINVWYDTTQPDSAGNLAYNATSPLTQGSLFTIVAETNTRCWKLDAGQQLFFGQSGVSGEPSGLGNIAFFGEEIGVEQVAVAVNPADLEGKANGTNVGKITYFFGIPTSTTHHLVYDLVVNDNLVDIIPSHDGVAQAKIASIAPNTWGLITSVWASNPTPWATKSGKGWAGQTALGAAGKTQIYSFVNKQPDGTEVPWEINQAGKAGGKVRTARYQAGANTALYLDDFYGESMIRNDKIADAKEVAGDARLNKFDQTYSDPGGVPVELSVFEVR